jgi:hypothetical protein
MKYKLLAIFLVFTFIVVMSTKSVTTTVPNKPVTTTVPNKPVIYTGIEKDYSDVINRVKSIGIANNIISISITPISSTYSLDLNRWTNNNTNTITISIVDSYGIVILYYKR